MGGGDLCAPLVDAFRGSTHLLPPPAAGDEKGEQAAMWGAGQSGVRAPSALLRDTGSRGCCPPCPEPAWGHGGGVGDAWEGDGGGGGLRG